jgi:hypothetical protein
MPFKLLKLLPVTMLCTVFTACTANLPDAASSASRISAAANPLSKEGQIARIRLQIVAAQVQGLGQVNIDSQGLLQADGADFRISSSDNAAALTGQVQNNLLELPVEQLGKGPYTIEITLPGGQVLTATLQDTLYADETRVLRAENVQIRQTEQNCGDNCTQIGGDVNQTQQNVTVEGNSCMGIGNQCSTPAN